MNEPKRYALRLPDISYGTEESPNGQYVRYEDYARLKAEVDRLTAFTTRTIIPNEELQAQVERLKQQVRYWEIESDCNHGRWLRCLEQLEMLRKEAQP